MNKPILDIHDPLIQAILDARVRELAPLINRYMGESDKGLRIRLKRASLAETDEEKALAKVLFED